MMASDITEPLNLGSDQLVTINQLVDIVEEIAGVRLRRRYKLGGRPTPPLSGVGRPGGGGGEGPRGNGGGGGGGGVWGCSGVGGGGGGAEGVGEGWVFVWVVVWGDCGLYVDL